MKIDLWHRPVDNRSRPTTAGFSLVELLVVIAIIGVLLSILLPAVQAARESVRRTQCLSNLRQLAMAAKNYEAAHGHYPVGAHNSLWMTWVVPLAGFLEEPEITTRYQHRNDRYLPEYAFNSDANRDVTQRYLSWLACPSDGFSPIRTTLRNAPSAHNYVACTGNGAYLATLKGWLSNPPPGPRRGELPTPGYGNGMYRWQGGAFVMSGATPEMTPHAEEKRFQARPMVIKSKDVEDGESKTLAFSEVIRRPPQADGRSADLRGLSWWGPGALFSTLVTPNGSYPDTLPGPGGCGSGSLRTYPPCYSPHSEQLPIVLAARSRHPGGVVASTLDGASRFHAETIDFEIWEDLGSAWGD